MLDPLEWPLGIDRRQRAETDVERCGMSVQEFAEVLLTDDPAL